ncbi:MAG: 23S rRNA (adenine(2503)-C(2))-methyltransferase RlmN [Gemmatimonadota bacterium]|nr:MAG: 23S rRNA (adenine(2503)-C(2))-methyltransferase RlmN [Gemmatimonadota bacterium]
MKTLLGLKTKELEQIALSLGLDAYRGRQLAQWMYRKRVTSFEAMTDLGKDTRERLLQTYAINPLKEKRVHQHQDGTAKYLFELEDGECIETVKIPHGDWETICVSTQLGCPIGCTFCASGLDYGRNLTAAEIIGQVLLSRGDTSTNVVFMGIGEPFLNRKELFRSLKILNGEVGIGARHLTVSTIGIVEGIENLAHLGMEVNLGISLHAPQDELRRRLIKTHLSRLRDILKAADLYFQKTGRRISFEYVMLSGVNDLLKHATHLGRLLKSFDFKCHVNLIPYNETDSGYSSSSPARIRAFQQCLEELGINVTVRQERGKGIQAACGQLRRQHLEGKIPS